MFSTLLSMLTAVPLLMFTTASSGSSWSASLNLLFFYITWSTLLLAHPPLKVELVGSLVVRALFFWLPALVSLLFDVALPSLARTVKLQGGSGSDRSGESAHRAKVVGWALVNTLLGVALQGAVEALFVHVLRRPTALRISSRLPLPGELLWDVFRGVVMREVRCSFPRSLLPIPIPPSSLSQTTVLPLPTLPQKEKKGKEVAGNGKERKGTDRTRSSTTTSTASSCMPTTPRLSAQRRRQQRGAGEPPSRVATGRGSTASRLRGPRSRTTTTPPPTCSRARCHATCPPWPCASTC